MRGLDLDRIFKNSCGASLNTPSDAVPGLWESDYYQSTVTPRRQWGKVGNLQVRVDVKQTGFARPASARVSDRALFKFKI